MSKQHSYVVLGNGIAGITAAEVLREHDQRSSITIIADDPFPAYYRPALKDFLGGRLPAEKLWARQETFYKKQRIRFLPARVMQINPAQHLLLLHDGTTIHYDALLLANGARARTLECPGLNLAGVSTLRSVVDYQEILHRLENVERIVVCGSGTLALESAETLRHRGYQATHLLRGNTLWSEVLDPVASEMVLQEERRDGIEVHCREEIAEILGKDGQVSGIVTTHGERIVCQMVLIAIGIEPLVDFLRASGIVCGRGVRVDAAMRTNIPDIYAAGDVVETVETFSGRARVLGQWFPAIQQAKIAAMTMLASLGQMAATGLNDAPAGQLYNATFLYGLDFVSVGLTTCPASPGFQEIIAAPQARSYRKAILYNGRIVGVLLLGDRRQALAFKRAIDHHANLAPIAGQLFAEGFDLDAWLSAQGIPAPLLTPPQPHLPGTFLVSSPQGGETRALIGVRDAPHVSPEEADAYFVPIPHPSVHVFVTETRLPGDGQVMTIGRQEGVSWLIEHGSVSRLHAEVVWARGAYLLRDTGSANGTFVNGSPLAGGNAHPLHPQDRVRFGDVQFCFELRPRTTSGRHVVAARPMPSGFAHLQGTALQAQVARLIPEAVLTSLPQEPTLVLMGANSSPRMFTLASGQRYSIGREQSNALVLPDDATSRQHAEIFGTPDGFYIRDLNSRYGTFVNQTKITNIFHLSHGDRIVLGNMLLYFSSPRESLRKSLPETTITTSQLSQAMAARMNVSRVPAEKAPVVMGLEHRQEILPLSGEQLKFEIDMCIGCNRCMEACPVPLSSQVTIAALNTATITKEVTPTVARFTHECVMCGSCVPVCPVDNHRDLLMLALKERLGVAWESHPDISRVVQVLPAGWTLPLLLGRLREQGIFRDPRAVPDTYLLHIAAASTQRILAPGEFLVREGEYGRDLFLILDGQVELTTTSQNKTDLAVALLQRGEYAGEDGLLTGRPYKTTARAQTPVLLLQVPEQVIQSLISLVPAVRQHFENFTHARSLYTILSRMELFEGVTDADLQVVIRATPLREYDRDERLFAEDVRGRPPRETVHILLEGFVKVARQARTHAGKSPERIIAYRQGGDYFAGGLDLLGDGHAVTVTTINRCRVAEVPRQVVIGLFQRYPVVEQRFAQRLQDYLEAAAATQEHAVPSRELRAKELSSFLPESTPADPQVQDSLHELVSDGVVEGTEVLVIDLDKCIHCNECEYACERRHGHSRMNRKGMVIGNISITTTCRQCQDPVCMLCSRAGIARYPNGEVYITESCIGCGICAERCPYGAISIVPVAEEPIAQNSWQRFSTWFTTGISSGSKRKTLPVIGSLVGGCAASGPLDLSPAYSAYDELRKKIAIKCDLCAGYRDQACVEACPAGAAIRVQPTSFFGSTEEILQRRA